MAAPVAGETAPGVASDAQFEVKHTGNVLAELCAQQPLSLLTPTTGGKRRVVKSCLCCEKPAKGAKKHCEVHNQALDNIRRQACAQSSVDNMTEEHKKLPGTNRAHRHRLGGPPSRAEF